MGTTSIVISVVLYSVLVAKYTAVGSVRLRSVAMNISQRALPAHRKPSEDQQTACCFDCLETRGEIQWLKWKIRGGGTVHLSWAPVCCCGL